MFLGIAMAIFFALLLILVLLGCWSLTLLGLPGNWLMAAAAAVYACLVPAQSPAALGWKTVVPCLFSPPWARLLNFWRERWGWPRQAGAGVAP